MNNYHWFNQSCVSPIVVDPTLNIPPEIKIPDFDFTLPAEIKLTQPVLPEIKI